jgi:valyl-tRNA synthetase
MILMTTYATGQIPFKTVYLHGMIRTRDGAKMSKSHPETMIDPLDMISKYGADALRLSMIVGQSPGADSRLYEEKIAGYRNFINKLWNASRFVLMQCELAKIDPKEIDTLPDMKSLSLADRAILHASEYLIEDVTKGLESYSLSEVGEKLYSFTWDYFCDWYLELSKGNANHAVLVHVLRRILTLLHPYCPFVTEELWSHVAPKNIPTLISSQWPTVKEVRKDKKAFDELQILIDVISAIRKLRTDNDVEPGKEVSVILVSDKYCEGLESQESHIRRMCKVGSLTILSDAKKLENVASAFLPDIEVHLSFEGLFDPKKLQESLEKEQAELTKYVGVLGGKLQNKSFVDRAPKELVDSEKQKLSEAEGKLQKIIDRLSKFS